LFTHHSGQMASSEKGATLLELLAGVAIALIALTTTTSLFFAQMKTQRDLQASTNLYENIRIPAQMLLEDARYALLVDNCSRTNVTFYTSEALDSVRYHFGVGADAKTLYRTETIGGIATTVQVAQDLIPLKIIPAPVSGSRFGCTTDDGVNKVTMRLEKTNPVPPGGAPIVLETKVFLRDN